MKTKKEEKVVRIVNELPSGKRAFGVKFPAGNCLLKAVPNANTDKLPANLLDVFVKIRAKADGIRKDTLCDPKSPSGRYTRWLVRQLMKRNLVKAIGEEKKVVAIAKKPKSAKKAANNRVAKAA